MKRQEWIGVGVLVVALLSAVVGAVWRPSPPVLKKRIALVRVEGAITAGETDLFPVGGAKADRLMETLEKVRKDPAVKAVVLRINSPGGSAAASYEIGREVQRLRESGKKVVASLGDVAASGGYWVAAGADYIVTAPGTMTGSIGVIMQTANLEELYRKLGITPVTIKSGRFKDIGNPSRPMTDEERALLQQLIDRTYRDFVDHVAEGRKGRLTRAQVEALADGRVVNGAQAVELGLADSIGNLKDAEAKAAELAGLKADEYEVHEYGKPDPFEALERLIETSSRLAAAVGALTETSTAGGPARLEAR